MTRRVHEQGLYRLALDLRLNRDVFDRRDRARSENAVAQHPPLDRNDADRREDDFIRGLPRTGLFGRQGRHSGESEGRTDSGGTKHGSHRVPS